MMNYILDPSLHISLLWLYAFVVLLFRKKISAAMYLGFIYYFLCISPIPHYFYKKTIFHTQENIGSADALIVLSGGTVFISKKNLEPKWFGESERFFTALNAFFDKKAKYLVFTGHDEKEGFFTEVESMKTLAMKFGVPESNIIAEDTSRNTYEHPLFLKEILKPYNLSKFIIVTSNSHMSRALEVFRGQGFSVSPLLSNSPLVEYQPFHNYSGYVKSLYYEILANFYYKLTNKL